ncbi:cyclodeaminase/cyclohydrolase family protein [Carboxydochorda subterranea]|uniref:Cyclodeaminase/cyclohydrolase family protein n=1 Tax=Carboxydichorda subterranea TaxID=3109565 RepID=A0ABZ1BYA5_9FIRM|nr:cyclodeaminase/cyclohydrolase family protein [Limnochorda sp. L945t]WRP17787.1 cyclodeaminase/cyclohydrolase family protein [Limnochorda sp. L945t]
MEPVAEHTVRAFVSELASADPVPGGGAAAAAAGAYGGALVAMVARVARRRVDDEELANHLEEWAHQADQLSESLLALASRDAEAFHQVMRAYRLPKGSESEARARTEAIHQALEHAARVPLQAVETAVRGLDLLSHVMPLVPVVALSDAGVAAWLLRACIEGAALNVRANWQSLPAVPGGTYQHLEEMVARSRSLFDEMRQRLGPLSNGGIPVPAP